MFFACIHPRQIKSVIPALVQYVRLQIKYGESSILAIQKKRRECRRIMPPNLTKYTHDLFHHKLLDPAKILSTVIKGCCQACGEPASEWNHGHPVGLLTCDHCRSFLLPRCFLNLTLAT